MDGEDDKFPDEDDFEPTEPPPEPENQEYKEGSVDFPESE